jgi:hypothetical protein
MRRRERNVKGKSLAAPEVGDGGVAPRDGEDEGEVVGDTEPPGESLASGTGGGVMGATEEGLQLNLMKFMPSTKLLNLHLGRYWYIV